MTSRTVHTSLPAILAFYCVAALFLVPWFGAVRSQDVEPEPVEIDTTKIASYDIQVNLNDEEHTLSGSETITWTNAGEVPADTLQLHLYMNAFRSPDTRFFENRGGWKAEDAGWIDITGVSLSDGTDLSDAFTIDQTVMSVTLPRSVAPGEVLRIDLSFEVQLPKIITRTGYSEKYYFIGQWFPKLGVYSGDRWICPQYHSFSEFYADFGSYRVEITVPRNLYVAATGIREKSRTDATTKTYVYVAEKVHDFAWMASPHHRRTTEELQWTGPDGENGTLEVHYMMHRDRQNLLPRYQQATRQSLEVFTRRYGGYPYSKLVIVDPAPGRGMYSGGMEYPMIITGGSLWLHNSLATGDKPIEVVTAHEFAHQYWHSAVASNEFHEAWLDEGLTTYTSSQVIDQIGLREGRRGFLYMTGMSITALHPFPWNFDYSIRQFAQVLLLGMPDDSLSHYRRQYLDQPDMDTLDTPASHVSSGDSYQVVAYAKPMLALQTLERMVGQQMVERVLRRYYQDFRFRHASGEEFITTFREVSGQDLSWFFQPVIGGSGTLDYAATELSPDTVRIERTGDLVFPQIIRLTLSNGSSFDLKWEHTKNRERIWMNQYQPVDGQQGLLYRMREGAEGRWLDISLQTDVALVSAAVDPETVYLLDTNLANNSISLEKNSRLSDRYALDWLRIMSRWLHGISTYN